MGFIVVVISGTCDDYSLGKQTPVSMDFSRITFASAGNAPMKTYLKEGVQKLQSNAPNAGACSMMLQK